MKAPSKSATEQLEALGLAASEHRELGLLSASADGRVAWMNEAARGLLGLHDAEAELPWTAAILTEDAERVRSAWSATCRDALPFAEDFRVADAGRESRWIRACGGMRGSDGYALVFLVDVDARKREEEARTDGRAWLERFAKGASLDDLLHDLAVDVERTFPGSRCALLLLDEEGATLRCRAAPSLEAALVSRLEALDASDVIPRAPVSVREEDATDGAALFLRELGFPRAWGRPILSATGEELGALWLFAPIEAGAELERLRRSAHLASIAIESRGAEAESSRLRQELRQVIDLVPHMIFAKDRDGLFLLANEALAQAYGTTVEELMNTPHARYHSVPSELARMLADDREVIDTGRPKEIAEETFVDAGGAMRILRTTKIPFTSARDGRPAMIGVAVDITEQQRVSESLRSSEERFRQLAEAINEVFWLTQWQERRVLYVSPAYERIWGRTCESLYTDSRSWADAIHPEDRERVERAFDAGAENGSYDVEYRILATPHGVRWIHDRAFPIRAADGAVYRVAGISEDVTARKEMELELERARDELEERVRERTASLQEAYRELEREARERERAQHALRESEQRFRELAETIVDVFWLTDVVSHRVLYVSPSYETTWGRKREDLYRDATDWVDAILPEDRQRIRDAFLSAFAGSKFDEQYRIRRGDGEIRWIHDRGFAICDEAGAPLRLAGTAMDVTERKRVEEALRESQRFNRQIAELTPSLLGVFDLEHARFVYLNSQLVRMLGYGEAGEATLPDGGWELVHPEDLPGVLAALEELRRATRDEPVEVEYRFRHARGDWCWLQTRCAVFARAADGTARELIGATQDVTLRKRAEERLVEHQEKLRGLANDLLVAEERERRQLASDLHDSLNQTLTLARIKLAGLRRSPEVAEGPGLDAKLEEIAELVNGANRSARSLTFQLSPPILHDLGFVPAVQWLAEDAERSYGLRVTVEDDGLPKPMDERMRFLLFRSVRELLINVVKHAQARHASVLLQRVDGEIHITVRDDGSGCATTPCDASSFGHFSMRERLGHLGGEMRIRSRPGEGTEVVLIAPLRTEQAAETSEVHE